jgi:glycosyltransferase involved in cell wall biosynthesis
MPSVHVVSDYDPKVRYDAVYTLDYAPIPISKDKIILTVHDLIEEFFPQLVPMSSTVTGAADAKQQAIRQASYIITVSQTTRQDVVNFYGVPEHLVTPIYHGVDPIFLASEQISAQTCSNVLDKYAIVQPFILTVGGRHGYKNFVTLLHAYGASNEQQRTMLINTGSQHQFSNEEQIIIQEYGLQKKVKLLGYVPDEDLAALYVSAALVIVPSVYEGFGLPLLEAMACGTVTASSQAPALLEIGAGIPLVFDTHNTDSLIATLEMGLSDEHSERVKQGQCYATQFTWENTAQKVIQVITSLMD